MLTFYCAQKISTFRSNGIDHIGLFPIGGKLNVFRVTDGSLKAPVTWSEGSLFNSLVIPFLDFELVFSYMLYSLKVLFIQKRFLVRHLLVIDPFLNTFSSGHRHHILLGQDNLKYVS